MSDQIFDLFTYSCIIFWKEILGFNYCHLLRILERMFVKGKRKQDTSNHPNINFKSNVPLLISINHFRWTIHHRCESFIMLILDLNISWLSSIMEQSLWRTWPKITQLPISSFQKNILNLNISMSNWRCLRMHIANSFSNLWQHFNNCILRQFPSVSFKQI